MTAENFYSWECNRCETTAHGGYREALQKFVDHHISTVHPLFTADRIDDSWLVAPQPPD